MSVVARIKFAGSFVPARAALHVLSSVCHCRPPVLFGCCYKMLVTDFGPIFFRAGAAGVAANGARAKHVGESLDRFGLAAHATAATTTTTTAAAARNSDRHFVSVVHDRKTWRTLRSCSGLMVPFSGSCLGS